MGFAERGCIGTGAPNMKRKNGRSDFTKLTPRLALGGRAGRRDGGVELPHGGGPRAHRRRDPREPHPPRRGGGAHENVSGQVADIFACRAVQNDVNLIDPVKRFLRGETNEEKPFAGFF